MRRTTASEISKWEQQPRVTSKTIGASREGYQSISNGVHHQFGGFVYTKCIHDVGTMHRDGVCAQVELACDFFVRFSLNDQLQDLKFPDGKAAVALAF